MAKCLLVSIILLFFLNLKGKDLSKISIKNSSLISSNEALPFWFTANQHGKFESSNQLLNITDLEYEQSKNFKRNPSFSWAWGGNLVAAFAETNYFQVNQAFARFSIKGWELKGGLFHDITNYEGLSTTNGNMARSSNARPYPMLRFSSSEYKPIPFAKSWLSTKVEYDEGLLIDNRYVEKTHLHHKSVYCKVTTSQTCAIQFGLEHFVMWGGISKDSTIGQMPNNLKAYWRYIFSFSGNDGFPETDQLNVAGNQFGTYQIKIKKRFPKVDVSLYLSHPFENWTGLYLRNWPDNLIGAHLKFKNSSKLVTEVLYEYIHMKQQSVNGSFYTWNNITEKWEIELTDNYYTHGLYKTGYTYNQHVMCSPLFFPVSLEADGTPSSKRAIRSTRFIAHHFGTKGNINNVIYWKSLLTYIQHFGTYLEPYALPRKRLAGYLELNYVNPKCPVIVSFSIATDFGNTRYNNFGFQISISKTF